MFHPAVTLRLMFRRLFTPMPPALPDAAARAHDTARTRRECAAPCAPRVAICHFDAELL